MDKENLMVTSDLCEEAGLAKPAEMMRQMATGTLKAYIVTEHYSEYNDEIYYLSEQGIPENVYFDKETAINIAVTKSAQELCRVNPLSYGYELSEVTNLSEEELSKKLSEIIGSEFNMPTDEEVWSFDPIFDERKLSDEQKIAIASLFTLNFYEVIETELNV